MKPLLLDLFCGAGGAAKGYADAGFEVVGVDIKPQKRWPRHIAGIKDCHKGDALEYVARFGKFYDAIHASPPCQAYSKGAGKAGTRHLHPDLIDEVRELLIATGKPYIIENIEQARHLLRSPIILCGQMFDLGVWRHRCFETSFQVTGPQHSKHNGHVGDGRIVTVAGHPGGSSIRDRWKDGGVAAWKEAMDIDWMTGKELAQAIPPAYTHWIGRQIIEAML